MINGLKGLNNGMYNTAANASQWGTQAGPSLPDCLLVLPRCEKVHLSYRSVRVGGEKPKNWVTASPSTTTAPVENCLIDVIVVRE